MCAVQQQNLQRASIFNKPALDYSNVRGGVKVGVVCKMDTQQQMP